MKAIRKARAFGAKQFLLKVRLKGSKDLYLGCVNVEPESVNLDDTKNPETVRKQKCELNKKAYGDLITTIENAEVFDCVEKACTVDRPNELASLAWANLRNQYEPIAITSLLELRSKWHKVTFTDLNRSPDTILLS